MRAAGDAELYDALIGALPYAGGPEIQARLDDRKRASFGLRFRVSRNTQKRWSSFSTAPPSFATRPLAMDAKAEEILARAGRLHLKNLLPPLTNLKDWTAANAEQIVRAYAEQQGAKLGLVAQPLRAALTGRSTSPGIFDVLEVLGREESLGRIEDQARL